MEDQSRFCRDREVHRRYHEHGMSSHALLYYNTRVDLLQLLKITKHASGHSELENDKQSVVLRAYGRDSDILIDRETEAAVPQRLAERGTAAPLYARFETGLLYRFVPGRICEPKDILKEKIWRALARRLGQWHGSLSIPKPESRKDSPPRTIWTVFQAWLAALFSANLRGSKSQCSFTTRTGSSLHRF